VTRPTHETGARGAGLAGRVGVLLLVYALVLAVVLFSPSNSVQTAAVTYVDHVLRQFLPDSWISFTRVEVLLNVVIIAPLTFLTAMVWPRVRWQGWTAYAFVGATTVELVQGVLLPGRDASFSDIVANTAGAMLGAVLCRAAIGSADSDAMTKG
jgi:glycopeptide antibiotics resistance protein